ncbi:MAG TPA: ABC transporter substrate-binding protein [Nocardioides sp.]|uniref:ABC transporter substrate-binding protein n=1 Tax=uncultured Nocardioides sp. TaxID=198441 RepID=UPI000EC78E68|nr:ABC transporter substrate-binding protein [uncultured Nocardioides sp.]HCB06592.1 ABC transporter substrate-binding protein [Nocardioides sp.]HRD62410.1 ABC transporter substrate-binding protein [Nocardioides sp.]HRI95442.1 ABC transporter substrate-binding protein [Nocardioides sp.]HRK45925.1 ABC transporter substrate-binding protein [Nocardioides sp.]
MPRAARAAGTIRSQRSDSRSSITLSRRGLLGIGLGAGAIFALDACGGDSSSPSGTGGASGGTGTITWAWQLPTTWDPVTSSAGSDVQMLALTYDALTALDDEGNAVGWLAESWAYNDAGDEVTFTLRSGLKFSDGSPLDADAVAKSINRARTQEGSLVAPQLADTKDVKANGDLDVVISLSGVNYQYPLLLAGKTGMVVNPAVFEKDVESLATQPAGSGPFTLTSYTQNDHAELDKNDSFYLADQIKVAHFKLYPAPDPATAVASAASGQYNVVRLSASNIEAAKSAGLEVQILDSMFVSVLDVNVSMAPFDNPAVVEALHYGIDREAIKKTSNFGVGDVNYQPFPSGYVGHNPELDDLYAYDPEKAKQILADAGLKGGVKGVFSAAAPPVPAVEQIQAQLKEIGIDLEIETIPATQFTQLVYIDHSKALVYDGFAGRESPVQAFQVLFSSTGLMNPGRIDNPELLAQLDKVRATPTDDPTYPALLQEATKIAVTNYPNTFLYNAPAVIARQKSVSELVQHPSLRRWEGLSA